LGKRATKAADLIVEKCISQCLELERRAQDFKTTIRRKEESE